MANSLLQAVEISASQFLDIFHHYDNDGNGFIEGKELQSFIRELRDARQQAGLLVQVLPTEENFLLFFRQQLSSCSHFIQAWRCYDSNHSGYIEADELKSFLNDLLLKAQRSCDDNKLNKYTAATLKIFDSNGDGKLCLSEMARLLPDEQNFWLRFQGVRMSKYQFNRIFDLCDQGGRGLIEDSELDGLIRHLRDKEEAVGPADLRLFMELSDGGKLYHHDLCLLLCDQD